GHTSFSRDWSSDVCSSDLTSGLSALAVLVQVVWAWRAFPRGHRVRGAALAGGAFMLVEVAIGAGIVLLRYVDDNVSVARALWMADRQSAAEGRCGGGDATH